VTGLHLSIRHPGPDIWDYEVWYVSTYGTAVNGWRQKYEISIRRLPNVRQKCIFYNVLTLVRIVWFSWLCAKQIPTCNANFVFVSAPNWLYYFCPRFRAVQAYKADCQIITACKTSNTVVGIISHADGIVEPWVRWRVTSETVCVCVCVCLSVSVYLRVRALKGKTAWAINTKLGGHTMHGSRLACVDLEVKGQGHAVIKCFAGVGCMSMRLHAQVFHSMICHCLYIPRILSVSSRESL